MIFYSKNKITIFILKKSTKSVPLNIQYTQHKKQIIHFFGSQLNSFIHSTYQVDFIREFWIRIFTSISWDQTGRKLFNSFIKKKEWKIVNKKKIASSYFSIKSLLIKHVIKIPKNGSYKYIFIQLLYRLFFG